MPQGGQKEVGERKLHINKPMIQLQEVLRREPECFRGVLGLHMEPWPGAP